MEPPVKRKGNRLSESGVDAQSEPVNPSEVQVEIMNGDADVEQELEYVELFCGLSPAYSGTLAQMKEGSLETDELHDAVQHFCMNPFEPILE